MHDLVVKGLVDLQEEIFRVTGRIVQLVAHLRDEDFEIAWKSLKRDPMIPYIYTKSFEVQPGITLARHSAVVV